MKSKLKEEPKTIENEPQIEIKNEGPSIASAKKNKFLIITASLVLIGCVVYFLFIKNSDIDQSLKKDMEPVSIPEVAKFEKGEKSPFEIEKPTQKNPSDSLQFLEKPATPDIPAVPELPENSSVLTDLILAPASKDKDKKGEEKQDKEKQNKDGKENQKSDVKQSNQESQNGSTTNQGNTVAKVEEEPINPRYSPIIVFGGGIPNNVSGVGYENNIIKLNADPIDSLKSTESKVETQIIQDLPNTIAQGKFLTAVLETAITTEMPGSIRAIIDRDVYGESGKEILIPRGSRIFGSYSSTIKRGQGRVDINWTRLIRQDGVSLSIAFSGSDQFGRAGIAGEVDNKYSSVVANSLLTSALAVGGLAAAQGILGNNSTITTTTNPSQGAVTTTGNATNQALYDVTKNIINIVGQVISNSIDLNPVIRIPQGTRITVVVNSDIKIPFMKRR